MVVLYPVFKYELKGISFHYDYSLSSVPGYAVFIYFYKVLFDIEVNIAAFMPFP